MDRKRIIGGGSIWWYEHWAGWTMLDFDAPTSPERSILQCGVGCKTST